jgi:hypothetical protein
LLLAAFAHAGEAPSFDAAVGEFMENHCLSCHTGKRAKGELELSRFETAASVRGAPSIWRRIARRVERGEMPPAKREQPEAAEKRAFLAWLRTNLPAAPILPGRVTARRLNRHEYANTVRDLLGIDLPPGVSLPADDVGHGFDNIGDVLSMSPALLERYVRIGEELAERAIALPGASESPVMRVAGSDLQGDGGVNRQRGGVWIFAPGAARASFRFPSDGEYVVRIRAWGQQAGRERCRARLEIGKRSMGTVTVAATRAKPEELEVRVRAKRGVHRISARFVNDHYNPRHPNPAERDRNLMVEWIEVQGPLEPPTPPPFQSRLIPPGSRKLRPLVQALARRAFRRPIPDADLDRLVAAIERGAPEGAALERKMRVAVVAVLVSPRFLFRVELDPDPKRERDLDGWELASRLSYFLWSSMPDDALFRAAATGALDEPDGLRREVRRMVRDARASAIAEHFATQWLEIGRLDQVEFDKDEFPDVDADLKSAMRAESVLFFDAVLREERDLAELLDADFTYVNQRLAKLYGIPGVRGARMRRVRLEGGRRGGVLTQASVLACTSNPTRTSPVKRGKWVLSALLDAEPPPPPEVVALDESDAATRSASLRDRLAAHRRDAACAVCHERMDVLGIALENFDPIGRWRTRDGRFAIDASGVLPDGTRVEGAGGLRRVLVADPEFARSFAKHLLTYALGRGVDENDDPVLRSILAEWSRGKRTIPRLIEAIVVSDAFRRRGPEEETK